MEDEDSTRLLCSAVEEDGEVKLRDGKAAKFECEAVLAAITWAATIRFDRLLQSPTLCNCPPIPETMSFNYSVHLAHFWRQFFLIRIPLPTFKPVLSSVLSASSSVTRLLLSRLRSLFPSPPLLGFCLLANHGR